LLHGLLLTLPGDLDEAGGPGLTGLPFTAKLAGRVRAGVASPVHAAALAAALFTGLDPPGLATIPVSALSGDGAALIVPFKQNQQSWAGAFFVPEPARPLLRAARAFLQLRGAPPTKALLSAGIGSHAHRVTAPLVPAGWRCRSPTTRWRSPGTCGPMPGGSARRCTSRNRSHHDERQQPCPRPHGHPAGPELRGDPCPGRADLGMPETTLNGLTGVTLRTLEGDPDQRGIGLPLLTQLATVLDLRLDDLVLTDEPPHSRMPL
jgi:hypothetical protein